MLRFSLNKDTRPSRPEVNAGQMPKDKFWQVVFWLYNYSDQTDWFHPVNVFEDKVKKVVSINPDELGEYCSIPVLMEKYNSIKTIVTLLVENFKHSGQNLPQSHGVIQPSRIFSRDQQWQTAQGEATAGYFTPFFLC